VPDHPALITCSRCGQQLVWRSARCWRCGLPVINSLRPQGDRPQSLREGLGTPGKALVIFAVFALVLFGMTYFTVRAHVFPPAVARAESPTPTASVVAKATASLAPLPKAKPGTYVVHGRESLFSVAQATGIDANLIAFWNVARYPTLASSPALELGWVLRLTGPPLPTQAPQPTQPPVPQFTFPPTAVVAIPNVYTHYFAGGAVVNSYAIYGDTPDELISSINRNGPYSAWLGSDAEAHVQISSHWNLFFETWPDGSCQLGLTAAQPITLSYVVVMPRWVLPQGASTVTITWWASELTRVAWHENHHIQIAQQFLPVMNAAVLRSNCTTVNATISNLVQQLDTQECQFDLQQYGYAMGLSLQSCLAKMTS